ncbi:helix-turn-helix domain-containing protein [Apilactobacillus timberlakei]|uniref:XRE family transcriptional regulator n=1 Tax=Apilactobacillus timberlakei TaxID=2008380 RepID=A0ABY2YSS9_9LACO|nr:helix-turn-helix transcriptional regulator [Apilactobacillus timberlakei]TPR13444.1 XRE family transcriptional regulator [Apilactobacillus timberlakei]TPR15517.1 XRE family transcriptional regulator [Apilactobacillus timberlakei]
MCIDLPKINKKSVGFRIHNLRNKSNLSMEELANKINVGGKSTINNWEKGIAKPRQVNLKYLSKIFNVQIGYILYGDMKDFIKSLLLNNIGLIIDVIDYSLDSEGAYINEDGIDIPNNNTITDEEINHVIDENINDIFTYSVKLQLGYYDYKKIITLSSDVIFENARERNTILAKINNIKSKLSISENKEALNISKMTLNSFLKKYSEYKRISLRDKISYYYSIKIDNLIVNDFDKKLDNIKKDYLDSVNEYKELFVNDFKDDLDN